MPHISCTLRSFIVGFVYSFHSSPQSRVDDSRAHTCGFDCELSRPNQLYRPPASQRLVLERKRRSSGENFNYLLRHIGISIGITKRRIRRMLYVNSSQVRR
jgi:hypothetical protein|eukprot:COSAG01_NODE_3518_length_5980_cov_2.131780_6_plen_101_part_00